MSIDFFTFALPLIKHSNNDISDVTGTASDFIDNKVGLKKRYILGKEETSVSLAVDACEKLFLQVKCNREDIDLLVCVTQNPDHKIPHNAGIIADKLGLSNSLLSFDLSLGCSGYVYGVQVVDSMLKSMGLKNAILVTSDPYSRIIAEENKDTNCVFGDAATATYICENSDRSKILSWDYGTDGSGSHNIIVPTGGSAKPLLGLLSGQDQNFYEREDLRLHMNGRAVFNFVMRRIPVSIDISLDRADLSREDINFFVLHQGSTYMLNALAKRANIPLDKMPINMDKYGNTVSSTIPILLAELDEKGKLAGSKVLISGFGVGLSWGTMIMEFKG
jgi:3-oxoacyl-[acyl-carrier-protein] synthase-3